MKDKPIIVCLCGSTRFMEAFFEAGWRETLAGKIVLSVGVYIGHSTRNELNYAREHGKTILFLEPVEADRRVGE